MLNKLDKVIDDVLFKEDKVNFDYAKGGGIPRVARSRSALNLQVGKWNQIIKQLKEWGVDPNTIRNEQSQIIPRKRPLILRDRRTGRRSLLREVTAKNQPDIQAIDPRTGRRINIEVETNAKGVKRAHQEIRRKIDNVTRNDPSARSAFLLIDRNTGRVLEKYVYDPISRKTTLSMEQDIRRRDVLDFEDYESDWFLDRAINEAIEEENLDYLDVPCVYGNWCGPGCSGPAPPVDGIDRCCQAHDRCYGRRGYFACSCDRDLVKCLAPYSARSRAAKIMGTYFKYSPCRPWA